ncbi:histidine kinase [Paenibacillus baekrokdamisoli]|uniref:histidine kinase n=1 Tax=Paenibacillus baekrokdamisoli TaxID=1712516 RepID=A0A3G9JMJ3_9BACL|nr:histidine kinase [Paenibacillus baekrokdamisoli]MBB3071758.1 two-component system sensor histidine kinase YesM [Paenibacillus baekrokdamisoli]BBH24259.1 histidine kinase [Paenibacillus baekrokdamisoli]
MDSMGAGSRRWRNVIWPDTLKGRLIILLIVVSITPIALIGFTSYYWMYKVQLEKISTNYQSLVDNEREAVEKALANLSSVSQLLVVNGGLGDDVLDYLNSTEPVDKTDLFLRIDKSLTNIIYSNPSVNGLFLYLPEYENAVQFESSPLKPAFSFNRLEDHSFKLLYQANLLSFNSPHPSVLKGHDESVLSLIRKIDYRSNQSYYIYLETRFGDLLHTFTNTLIGSQVKQLLTDKNGTVMFSELTPEIPEGTQLSANDARLEAYKQFSATSSQGWMLYFLVPLTSYEKEMNAWQIQFIGVAILSLIVTVLAASYIWRMVYRPLQGINKEMKRFSYKQDEQSALKTNLQEFDILFSSFRTMREKIVELIYEVEYKEKRRGELEVEKLMSQINPHFLHNSLNTIQWLARANGQTEIVNLVKVFTRVLHYNMAKSSMIVTIQEEIGALYDYIELQNVRYDHRFNVKVETDQEINDIPIPRFVLQPLVENALYHGLLSEHGNITVTIGKAAHNRVYITVVDSGKGMSAEKIQELVNGQGNRQSGLGIGLNYVKKMLEVYYGHNAEMVIESIMDEGTTITIVIPDQLTGREADA